MALSSNGTVQLVSLAAASSAEKAMQPDKESYGSLRGLLGTVSVWPGFHVVIHDEATERNVHCVFADDDQAERAVIDAFGSRVAAWGKIHYRSDGTPSRLYVETFKPLAKDTELTPIGKFRGILKPQ